VLFSPTPLSPAEDALRHEVREWLAATLPADFRPGLGLGGRHDPAFSRELAKQGWVGMTIPQEYGGAGASTVERFVVVEELLAAGAPIAAHWIGERQTAPALLRFGTEEQRQWFLPRIAAGECFFSLGMSEPDAGSDLASVRTTATRTEEGWRVDGTKVWTTNAHLNHFFVVLCRTSAADDRHAGLSQFIVDLSSPGVSVSPIPLIDGELHVNEVVLDGVGVPEDRVLGEVGQGWAQVTAELAHERSGPDRYLSVLGLLRAFLAEHPELDDVDDAVAAAFGRIAARLWSIRQLSLAVARSLEQGEAPATEAALVKDVGTVFEQEVVETMRELAATEIDPEASSLFERLLAECVLNAPSWTLRGGTTEVLRGIAGKALTRGGTAR
jgi:alkylation response protein AidB-like acyl-CoA dehydrogenase